MSVNFIHLEIERIHNKRTAIAKRLACVSETAPIAEDLNEMYFDLTWQQNMLQQQASHHP